MVSADRNPFDMSLPFGYDYYSFITVWTWSSKRCCSRSTPTSPSLTGDWTEDPRAADDSNGGTMNLLSPQFFGTSTLVDGPLADLHNGDLFAGSRSIERYFSKDWHDREVENVWRA